ncbi:MAG: UMP kinase [Candidatus Thermoplasmatota archaeon]|nr:UMP kinase [Candidatus Thermoplasmatota archaeon]
METVVVSIGGSILAPEAIDPEFVMKIAKMLKSASKKFKVYAVVGGGKTARKYIDAGRAIGADEFTLDDMGIAATRMNARLLIAALGESANPVPPEDVNDAAVLGKKYEIVVMGGTVPGHTTDAVAASLAEKVGAKRFINATSIDGVYTADPKKDKNAKKIETLTHKELMEIVSKNGMGAGVNSVIDPVAALILFRSKLETLVVNGYELKELESAVMGKKFKGSIIKS